MLTMNLERALEVLNQYRHRDSSEWQIVPGLRNPLVRPHPETLSPAWLNEFEAIAIATEYLRRAAQAAPGALTDLYSAFQRAGAFT
jgi:hypothetical protein